MPLPHLCRDGHHEVKQVEDSWQFIQKEVLWVYIKVLYKCQRCGEKRREVLSKGFSKKEMEKLKMDLS